MLEGSIDEILDRWAIWTFSGCGRSTSGWPLHMLKRKLKPSRLPLSDEDALIVDRALAKLKSVDRFAYVCIEKRYLHQLHYRQIAARVGCGKDKARAGVKNGEHYLYELLFENNNYKSSKITTLVEKNNSIKKDEPELAVIIERLERILVKNIKK